MISFCPSAQFSSLHQSLLVFVTPPDLSLSILSFIVYRLSVSNKPEIGKYHSPKGNHIQKKPKEDQ
jgi:hypothetical protein